MDGVSQDCCQKWYQLTMNTSSTRSPFSSGMWVGDGSAGLFSQR